MMFVLLGAAMQTSGYITTCVIEVPAESPSHMAGGGGLLRALFHVAAG